jgi:hypothetical protein
MKHSRSHRSYPTRPDFSSQLPGCNPRLSIDRIEPVCVDGKPHSFTDWEEQRGVALCSKCGKRPKEAL